MPKPRQPASQRSSAASGAHGNPAARSSTITEAAQQIWLAGMGAFNRAQSEGSKLFEALVRDGLSLEQHARDFAGEQAHAVRDAIGQQAEHIRERATSTLDKLEQVFDARVQRSLERLDSPRREDITALTQRIDALTAALQAHGITSKAEPRPKQPRAPRQPPPVTAANRRGKPTNA